VQAADAGGQLSSAPLLFSGERFEEEEERGRGDAEEASSWRMKANARAARARRPPPLTRARRAAPRRTE